MGERLQQRDNRHTRQGPRLIVALDFPAVRQAEELAAKLEPTASRLKIGKELFVRGGPQLIERLQARGFEIFLDLKFHDIPNTVAAACRAAAELGVWMVNVHALGGSAMMQAAQEAVAAVSTRPLLIAVTVLTSHDAASLRELGLPEPAVLVPQLARLARQAGLDGVVCSAQEARLLRAREGSSFCLGGNRSMPPFVGRGVQIHNGPAIAQNMAFEPPFFPYSPGLI